MPGVEQTWWRSSRGEKFQNLRLDILPTRTQSETRNAMLRTDKRTERMQLYCQPDKLVLDLANYVEILDRQIKTEATKNTQAELDDMSVGLVLLKGLQDTFPCAGK